MNGGRGGSSGEGEIVIVIFWVGLIGGRGGGVLVVGWWRVLWSEAFVDQG